MTSRLRVLHPRLAALCATLRHGEMVYVADAGSGTHAKSLVPLADDVEVIDVALATNIPSVPDVVNVLCESGDFEGAFVTEDMAGANPDGRKQLVALFGEDNVHELRYLPEFYQLRDRVKAFIQTGDYGVHANVILIAGYPSPVIPTEWMTNPDWLAELHDAPGRGA